MTAAAVFLKNPKEFEKKTEVMLFPNPLSDGSSDRGI